MKAAEGEDERRDGGLEPGGWVWGVLGSGKRLRSVWEASGKRLWDFGKRLVACEACADLC